MKNYYKTGNYTAPEENGASAAAKKAAQPQLDYALDGFTPPSGVTDKYAVHRIQGILGVKQDGIWGLQTQAAWTNQFGTLWQPPTVAEQQPESAANSRPAAIVSAKSSPQTQHLGSRTNSVREGDAQIAFHAPKGISSAAEIRQVQQRLGVEMTGAWNAQTQKAWDNMRLPQPGYQAPEGANTEREKNQIPWQRSAVMNDIWDHTPQIVDTKKTSDLSWVLRATADEATTHFNEQIQMLYDRNEELEELSTKKTGSLKASLEQEAVDNLQKIEQLLEKKYIAKRQVRRRMDKIAPFYSYGADSSLLRLMADTGKDLWYDENDISASEFYRLLQGAYTMAIADKFTWKVLIDMVPASILITARTLHYSHNQKMLEKPEAKTNESKPASAKNTDTDDQGKKEFYQGDYIIDQSKMTEVKYALGETPENGCGWIAAYNALVMLGNKKDAAQVLADMEPGALLFGSLGTNPFYIADYFIAQGNRVEIHTSMEQAEKAAKEADASIYVYLYVGKDERGNPALGGHYVAFNYNSNNERFFFYNGQPRNELRDDSNGGYQHLSAHYLPGDVLRFTISIYKPEGK